MSDVDVVPILAPISAKWGAPLSLAWTQITVSLISSLNSLNLYSEEEPGNRAGWSQDCPAVKLFICQFLLAEDGCGYKLIVMSGDWTRLDYGYAAMNHILMLSLSSVSKCSRWEHKMWELCFCWTVRMSDQGWPQSHNYQRQSCSYYVLLCRFTLWECKYFNLPTFTVTMPDWAGSVWTWTTTETQNTRPHLLNYFKISYPDILRI